MKEKGWSLASLGPQPPGLVLAPVQSLMNRLCKQLFKLFSESSFTIFG